MDKDFKPINNIYLNQAFEARYMKKRSWNVNR